MNIMLNTVINSSLKELKCVSIFVLIVTSTALSQLADTEVFPCSLVHEDDNVNGFRCQDGTGCIGIEHVCDGIRHCPDSSDEVFCLLTNKRARRSTTCILPAYPNHGTYKVLNNAHARPGQSFDSVALTVLCRRGYGVVRKDSAYGNTTEVFCVNGVWYQNIPECVRFCKLDPDPSVRYLCHVPGVGLNICNNYVAPGTLVSPVCNTPFYYSTESFPKMKCTIGFWNYVAQCKAECGRVSPKAYQLVIDGKEAGRGELPWHVGIYRKVKGDLEQICGGSLVSKNVVISAAHCFWSDVRKVLPASNYKVAIGKLYRSWDSERDVGVQKSDIKQIKIPSLFQGAAANFQEDIAILILTTPFVYHTYVRPVCLNFDINFERWQLQQGNSGKVAGWGLTTANGNASPILQVVDMPFINEVNCIKTLPPSFSEYITGDKFCAGYTNGTALCRGDSVGGLAFADKELGIDRYYLRGIVSAAPRNDEKMCNDNAYTTFTKITKHQEFINDALAESTSRTCPFYSFQCVDGSCVDQGADCDGKQDCADGSDESNELCKPAAEETVIESHTSSACVLPPYPAHGSYIVSNVSNATPGQELETFVLTIVCSEGYSVATGVYNQITNDTEVYCNNGVWYQKFPKCVPAACERDGIKGKCLPPSACPTVLKGTIIKYEAPLCTSPSDKMPLICCIDYDVVGDRRVLLFNPLLSIGTVTGKSVANDKCLEYMKNLNYPCKTDYNLVNGTKLVNPNVICYKRSNKRPGGELSTAVRDSFRGEFPHMALLGYGKTIDTVIWKCGGAIISERFIISLARCSHYSDFGPVKYAALGLGKRSDPVEMNQQYNVKRFIRAPNFRPAHPYHDIGLLETDREIAFSSAVLPACINGDSRTTNYEYYPGFSVVIDPVSKGDSFLDGTLVGPLQSQDQGECPFLIWGLMSFPVDCDINGNYTTLTEIHYYAEWIENIVWA